MPATNYNYVMIRHDWDRPVAWSSKIPWLEATTFETVRAEQSTYGGKKVAALFIKHPKFRDRLLMLGWIDVTKSWKEEHIGLPAQIRAMLAERPGLNATKMGQALGTSSENIRKMLRLMEERGEVVITGNTRARTIRLAEAS